MRKRGNGEIGSVYQGECCSKVLLALISRVISRQEDIAVSLIFQNPTRASCRSFLGMIFFSLATCGARVTITTRPVAST